MKRDALCQQPWVGRTEHEQTRRGSIIWNFMTKAPIGNKSSQEGRLEMDCVADVGTSSALLYFLPCDESS